MELNPRSLTGSRGEESVKYSDFYDFYHVNFTFFVRECEKVRRFYYVCTLLWQDPVPRNFLFTAVRTPQPALIFPSSVAEALPPSASPPRQSDPAPQRRSPPASTQRYMSMYAAVPYSGQPTSQLAPLRSARGYSPEVNSKPIIHVLSSNYIVALSEETHFRMSLA